MKYTLTFLGTGAACGVPSFYCGCAACLEAINEPRYERTRCGILIQGGKNTLVDSPPELRNQLLRAGVRRIDHFILTHGHYDHSGGLGDLEFHIRVDGLDPIPSFMTGESEAWMEKSFGHMADVLSVERVEAGQEFELDGVKYAALEVTHSPGTLGLLIETGQGRRLTAYLPDTGPLPKTTFDCIRGVDTLILGATFWGKNLMPKDHLSVEEAVHIARDIRPKRFYLTHISMHYDTPVTNHELEAYLKPFGDSFHIAYDGLCINI